MYLLLLRESSIKGHNSFLKANDFHVYWGVNHHHQRCLQIGCCQLYVWGGQERRSCEVTSIKLPACYTPACPGCGGVGWLLYNPEQQSGHIQLAQGFGFTRTLEVGAWTCNSLWSVLSNWWIWEQGLSQYIHVGSIKPEQVDINQRGHCWNRVQHKCAVECNRARKVGR